MTRYRAEAWDIPRIPTPTESEWTSGLWIKGITGMDLAFYCDILRLDLFTAAFIFFFLLTLSAFLPSVIFFYPK